MRFDKNRFTCQCETRQKGLRVQILLFYWSFSSDIVAVKRLICLNFLQKGRETCARITCYDGGACDPAEPCKKRGLHAAPVIRAKPCGASCEAPSVGRLWTSRACRHSGGCGLCCGEDQQHVQQPVQNGPWGGHPHDQTGVCVCVCVSVCVYCNACIMYVYISLFVLVWCVCLYRFVSACVNVFVWDKLGTCLMRYLYVHLRTCRNVFCLFVLFLCVFVHVCVHEYVWVHARVRVCVCVCIYICVCVHECAWVCMYVCVCVCMFPCYVWANAYNYGCVCLPEGTILYQYMCALMPQVIRGVRYNFTLSLVTTACRNSHANQGKKLGECKLAADAEVTEQEDLLFILCILLGCSTSSRSWAFQKMNYVCDRFQIRCHLGSHIPLSRVNLVWAVLCPCNGVAAKALDF